MESESSRIEERRREGWRKHRVAGAVITRKGWEREGERDGLGGAGRDGDRERERV